MPNPPLPTAEGPTTTIAPDAPGAGDRTHQILSWLLLVPVGIFALVSWVHSLTWRMELDSPLAHYSAFSRAEFGTIPYAQLFEVSFPGTLLVHLGITRVAGYGDAGFMAVNFLWFAALAAAVVKLMLPFGRTVAVAAAVLLGVACFEHGPGLSLQRECLVMLPVMVAAAVSADGRGRPALRRAVIGLLFGCAAAIKPHVVLGLLPIVLLDLAPLVRGSGRPGAQRAAAAARAVLVYLAGLVVAPAAVLVWLVASGGFGAWLEMTRRYLPLYLAFAGGREGLGRVSFFVETLRTARQFGGQLGWGMAAAVATQLAVMYSRPGSRERRVVFLLAGEALVFGAYPAIAGQFWFYHYFPLVVFLTALAALCLRPLPLGVNLAARRLPLLVLLVALFVNGAIADPLAAFMRGQSNQQPKLGRVDAVAKLLQERLRPGDTVQPLDWVGGAVHAMLIARARLATRFMYDYHFYHHVSNPFIQELRRRFLLDFARAKPRFVLEFFWVYKPALGSSGDPREFPELRAILDRDYQVVQTGRDYRVLERRH